MSKTTKTCGTRKHYEATINGWGHCRFPLPIWLTETMRSLFESGLDSLDMHKTKGTDCPCHQPREEATPP